MFKITKILLNLNRWLRTSAYGATVLQRESLTPRKELPYLIHYLRYYGSMTVITTNENCLYTRIHDLFNY